jgi:hypothetical protein
MNQAMLAQGDGQALPPNFQTGQSPNRFMNESRRMEAEEIMNQTAQYPDLFTANDQESILIKATIIAKYMTLDQILERKYQVTEPQLKRVLYNAYFDEIEKDRGFAFKLRKWARRLKK